MNSSTPARAAQQAPLSPPSTAARPLQTISSPQVELLRLDTLPNATQIGPAPALTPPSTPLRPRRERTISGGTSASLRSIPVDDGESIASTNYRPSAEEKQPPQPRLQKTWAEILTPLPYDSSYALVSSPSSSSGYLEYGAGVWSTIYGALSTATTDHSASPPLHTPTPPASPVVHSPSSDDNSQKINLAIKIPRRRDAYPILANEARILTFLHRHDGNGMSASSSSSASASVCACARAHIVHFFGYDAPRHALVMEALPFTLEVWIREGAKKSREEFSTRTMRDPVVGVGPWIQIAEGLIAGMAWMHGDGRRVVHGDVKPSNILMRGRELRPVFCDFSSARVAGGSGGGDDEAEEISAVTTEYTAPELLAAFYRRGTKGNDNDDMKHDDDNKKDNKIGSNDNDGHGGRAISTFASDVFSLGITLLVAATGESPYAGARMEMARLAMAREGRPLDFARGGEQASRVMVGALVTRSIAGALERDPGGRVRADMWLGRVG